MMQDAWGHWNRTQAEVRCVPWKSYRLEYMGKHWSNLYLHQQTNFLLTCSHVTKRLKKMAQVIH